MMGWTRKIPEHEATFDECAKEFFLASSSLQIAQIALAHVLASPSQAPEEESIAAHTEAVEAWTDEVTQAAKVVSDASEAAYSALVSMSTARSLTVENTIEEREARLLDSLVGRKNTTRQDLVAIARLVTRHRRGP